jgi:regulatory protein
LQSFFPIFFSSLGMEKKTVEALNKCMELCSKAEKCTSDIRKKLFEWGISSEDAQRVIDELKQHRFIDDQRYAETYARDKFRFNHWGKVKIAFQLKSKSITDSIIFDALDGIDEEEYMEKLKEMLKQKSRSVKATSGYEGKAKLIRFAQSRGFEYEQITKALA